MAKTTPVVSKTLFYLALLQGTFATKADPIGNNFVTFDSSQAASNRPQLNVYSAT